MTPSPRFFISRHGETVFNAAGRLQGDQVHTPLTRAGFAQADAMGAGLKAWLDAHPGDGAPLTLWASPYGRALQTLAVVAEHLGADWHAARTDPRLREIGVGAWSGWSYDEVAADGGPLVDPATGLFNHAAPGGEWYDAIAARLADWLAGTVHEPGDRLIVMHGVSARVLRGLMTGLPIDAALGAGVAPSIPQGSMVMIQDGVETLVHLGDGPSPA